MSRSGLIIAVVVAGLSIRAETGSHAQQVQLTSPYQTMSDSFYENFGFGGINMGRSGPGGGWYFNTGPAGSTPPQFGGYDPGADARFGMRFGGPLGFGFNMLAGQGSSRSNTVTAPTIVMPNGGSGSLFSGSIRPFVTGVVPIVGNAPAVPMMPIAPQYSVSPLAQRLAQLQQQPATQAGAGADRDPVPVAPPPRPAADDAGPLVIKGGQVQGDPEAGRPAAAAASGDSTANHGDLSVAEIRRQQAAEEAARLEEIQVRIEKAKGLEEAGKPGQAKIYYQQAATRADGELKQQLLDKIRSLAEAQ